MTVRLNVDAANPGQFFACCGLFELASRLEPEATAHFEPARFVIACRLSLPELMVHWTSASLEPVDPSDSTASPLDIGTPFTLRLDWWKDEIAGGRELKVWAGTMQSSRIANAMMAALRDPALHGEHLLDHGQVVYDPAEPTKKVEPFYFDARRALNAHSRDIGFSPNDLDLTTTAFPATEVLCLIGLQRFRPAAEKQRRLFTYRTWKASLPATIASAVVAGAVVVPGVCTYRFETWYRTGQKKHKAFRSAALVREGD